MGTTFSKLNKAVDNLVDPNKELVPSELEKTPEEPIKNIDEDSHNIHPKIETLQENVTKNIENIVQSIAEPIQEDPANFKYKTIILQDLKPVKDNNNYYNQNDFDTKKSWLHTKCDHYYGRGKCECNVLAYLENFPVNTQSLHKNSFYAAALNAYNTHTDLILSPDDVWMVICFEFSKYVNVNAEILRNKLVSFDGKKKLEVQTDKELLESQWDEFFTLMIQAIKNNTKDGVVDTLQANFSTTGRIESIMSTATVMDSFKKFFKYGRCIPCCGIRAVKFMGTLEDWTSLQEKTLSLKNYKIHEGDVWSNYIDSLQPILKEFVNTYNNKPNVDYWNKIMNITSGRLGSGSTSYVSGWIVNFFGLEGKKVESYDIKSYNINVPVHIDNKLTGQQKDVEIVGGFGGCHKKIDEDGSIGYRPQLSMIVYHNAAVKLA